MHGIVGRMDCREKRLDFNAGMLFQLPYEVLVQLEYFGLLFSLSFCRGSDTTCDGIDDSLKRSVLIRLI